MSGGVASSLVGGFPLSNSMPPSESTGTPGSQVDAARGDHVHPRLSSATTGTLAANGEAIIVFTRTFAVKPCVQVLPEEAADNPPTIFKVKSWTQDAQSNYTGCVIKGYRGQTLPAVLSLLTALVNFNVFGGSASGVGFSCLAIQPSN